MAKKTDSNLYTVLFATAMVAVVGALLAFFSSFLKPTIDENKRIEKQQNILYAMGVNENDQGSAIFVSKDKVADAFAKYIKKQLVLEIKGGKIVEKQDPKAYLIDVKKQQELGREGKTRKLPLFIGQKDGKTFYISPIMGKGLWDAIWGYIAMDKDMVIQGAYFDHKGETPGLGANIKERYFMDDFIGEHLEENGVFKGVDLVKGSPDPDNANKTDHKIDAISGATLTSDGVSAMIKSDLSLYIPYFKKLEAEK